MTCNICHFDHYQGCYPQRKEEASKNLWVFLSFLKVVQCWCSSMYAMIVMWSMITEWKLTCTASLVYYKQSFESQVVSLQEDVFSQKKIILAQIKLNTQRTICFPSSSLLWVDIVGSMHTGTPFYLDFPSPRESHFLRSEPALNSSQTLILLPFLPSLPLDNSWQHFLQFPGDH